MKKLYTIALVVAFFIVGSVSRATAQNIQLYYDAGRNCATSTVEMFHPDRGGSTFFFVDFDYGPFNTSNNQYDSAKAFGAYWEIARELNFWQKSKASWLSVHLEYNGGLNTAAGSFNNAWLGGLTYSGHSKDFSKTWSISAMYKVIPHTVNAAGKSDIHNFQITGVWGINFAKGWCRFSGFIDFWREARPWQGTEYILLAEPQIWFNFNRIKGWEKVNLSVGAEIELSNNFVKQGFAVNPAVGLKWVFR